MFIFEYSHHQDIIKIDIHMTHSMKDVFRIWQGKLQLQMARMVVTKQSFLCVDGVNFLDLSSKRSRIYVCA